MVAADPAVVCEREQQEPGWAHSRLGPHFRKLSHDTHWDEPVTSVDLSIVCKEDEDEQTFKNGR